MSQLVEFKKIEKIKVPATTSLIIAEVFDKDHFHVLRDIDTLIFSGKFSSSNFGCSNYVDIRGKTRCKQILDSF